MEVKLVITFDNGQVNITGPIHDKVLCYGLLDAAKDAIRDFVAQQQGRHIIAPNPSLNLQTLKERN